VDTRQQEATAAHAPAPSAQPEEGRPIPVAKRTEERRVTFSSALAAEAGRVDDSYFASYSYFDIHREMLADKVCPASLPPMEGLGDARQSYRFPKGEINMQVHTSCPAGFHVSLFRYGSCHCRRARRPTERHWSATRSCCAAPPCWTSAAARASCRCLRHVAVLPTS
jgi:hypothetical protein